MEIPFFLPVIIFFPSFRKVKNFIHEFKEIVKTAPKQDSRSSNQTIILQQELVCEAINFYPLYDHHI